MNIKDSEQDSDGQSNLSSQYQGYSEDISYKRVFSEFPVRSKVHNLMHESVLSSLGMHESILDLGCGDGVLTSKFLGHANVVVGIDVSIGNVIRANEKALLAQLPEGKSLEFREGDICELPYKRASFEVVHSHHVLEHVFDFGQGLAEHKRLAAELIIISLPTAWSPIAWTLLGGTNYWSFGRSSIPRTAYGLLRVLWSWGTGRIGVDERNYAGLVAVPHIFFFPRRITKKMECADWKVTKSYPQVIGLPWMLRSLRLSSRRSSLGHGTVFILSKR